MGVMLEWSVFVQMEIHAVYSATMGKGREDDTLRSGGVIKDLRGAGKLG